MQSSKLTQIIQTRKESEAILHANKQLKAAREVEKKIDAVNHQLDELNLDDLDALRRRRIKNIQQSARKAEEWRVHNHGILSEIQNQKDWFDQCKTSERVVTHFYRPSTKLCEVMDKHLIKIAAKHLETKFIKINAEKSPFLSQRLNIEILPTLIMSINGFTEDRLVGFEDIDGFDKCKTDAMEKRLAKKGVIHFEGDLYSKSSRKADTLKVIRKSELNKRVFESDEDSD